MAPLQPVATLLLAVVDRVARYIQAVHLDARHHLGEVMEQESLAATHVENSVYGADAVVFGHRPRDSLPPPFDVAVTAIVDAPVAVPIVISPALRQRRRLVLRILRIVDPRKVVA